MAKMLDHIQAMLRGEAPPAPVALLIGFKLVALEAGQITIALDAGERHTNPMGTLHGGILCDIADAAMGLTYAATLDEDESYTTLEFKINFLKPVWQAQLRAVGKIVKRGRTIGLVECDVIDEQNNLVARASSTCMTLRGEMAKGR